MTTTTLTPAQFRAQHDLSESQFKRLKAKAAKENPDVSLTQQDGNAWFLTPEGAELITQLIPTRRDQSNPPGATSPTDQPLISPDPSNSVAITVIDAAETQALSVPQFSGVYETGLAARPNLDRALETAQQFLQAANVIEQHLDAAIDGAATEATTLNQLADAMEQKAADLQRKKDKAEIVQAALNPQTQAATDRINRAADILEKFKAQ